jgi:uncharacterized protein
MVAINDNTLRDIVDAIVREVDPQEVVLFGSWAKGTAKPDSDLDLLVIEREPFGPRHDRRNELRRIRRALSSFRISKDILVFSADEAARWKDSLNHVLSVARREGKSLYERP